MILAEIQSRVNEVRELADDPEAAHGKEDDLWLAVLRGIADGSIPLAEACVAARLAVSTQDIKFERWYA